ncbi:MAG: glycosyltransferase family 39 protein [Acidobacteria bacterium]|nr:glycosyltransferase family 39 protein [Acidobacteriota bacterium]
MRTVAVALLAASMFAVGIRWGTFAAGGSDSFCYLHQAERWASLLRHEERLQVSEPLVLQAPWPDAALAFAPAGHIPSSTVPGAIVPVCAAGLSIVMGAFVALGGVSAAFLVVPLFGVLLVAATFSAGSRFAPRVGVAAALVTAASPIVLYQLVQPMSDVPAAALWTASVAAATSTRGRGPVWGGLAAGAAIVIRPNLVPLVLPIAIYALWRPGRAASRRRRDAAAFGAGVFTGCAAVALIQQAYYGSPMQSGYGALGQLFDMSHVLPNAARYTAWLTATQTLAWLLALGAPVLLPGALTRLYAALILVNVACYLPYAVFDDWSFLRFLLPTLPLLVILMIASVDAICRRLASWTARPVVALVAVVLALLGVREAATRQAFRLHAFEARYERAGRFVARRLPANALVITNWQSGSVRFYSGRPTLVWDALDPAWLDRALTFLRARGFDPVLLFESWEEPHFRQRFRASPLGALDWPPAAEIAGRIRVYRPDDRQKYRAGLQPPTEYVP